MRYGLIMLVIIFSFIGGIIVIQKGLNDKINIEPGQVLGASEFVGNSSADAGLLSIQLLEKQIRIKVPVSHENLIPVRIGSEDTIVIDAIAGAAVFDHYSGKLLFDKDPEKSLPIASITKLATALVFLENNPGWETVYEIQKDL